MVKQGPCLGSLWTLPLWHSVALASAVIPGTPVCDSELQGLQVLSLGFRV